MSVDSQHANLTTTLFSQNALERGYCVGTSVFFVTFVSLTLQRFDRYLEASLNTTGLQQYGGANVFVRSYDRCRKESDM